jgi:hypothetical protein
LHTWSYGRDRSAFAFAVAFFAFVLAPAFLVVIPSAASEPAFSRFLPGPSQMASLFMMAPFSNEELR